MYICISVVNPLMAQHIIYWLYWMRFVEQQLFIESAGQWAAFDKYYEKMTIYWSETKKKNSLYSYIYIYTHTTGQKI